MYALDAIEKYFTVKNKKFEVDEENLCVTSIMRINNDSCRFKVILGDGNILRFRLISAMAAEPKKLRALMVMANVVNCKIKMGKFVVTGTGMFFEFSRHSDAEALRTKEIDAILAYIRQTASSSFPAFYDLNSGKIQLKDLIGE